MDPLPTLVYPFVVAAMVLCLSAAVRSRRFCLGGVAVAAGFATGFVMLKHLPAWRPQDGSDWVFHITVLCGLLSVLVRPAIARIVIGVVCILLVAFLIAHEINEVAGVIPVAIAMVAVYITFAVRETVPPAACIGAGLLAALAGVVLNTGSLHAGFLGMSLSAAGVAAFAVTPWPRFRNAAQGWTGPAATAATGLLAGRAYGSGASQIVPLALLFLAAMLGWLLMFKPFHCRRRWLLVLVAAGLAGAAAVPEVLSFMEQSGSSEYSQ